MSGYKKLITVSIFMIILASGGRILAQTKDQSVEIKISDTPTVGEISIVPLERIPF